MATVANGCIVGAKEKTKDIVEDLVMPTPIRVALGAEALQREPISMEYDKSYILIMDIREWVCIS